MAGRADRDGARALLEGCCAGPGHRDVRCALAARAGVRCRGRGEKYHDYCGCSVEESLGDSPPTSREREHIDLYERAAEARDAGGLPRTGENITAKMRGLGQGVVSDSRAPETQTGGAGNGKKPPGRFDLAEMDFPEEYPPLPDGWRVPFAPRDRPRPSDEDRARVLAKHRRGANAPMKTMFPEGWSDDDIMTAIDMAGADPAVVSRSGDKLTFDREVGGELVRVHIRLDQDPPIFWTAYPPNGKLAP